MKRNYKPLFFTCIFTILLVFIISGIFLLPSFQAEPVSSRIYMELGKKTSTNPETYIECSSWSMPVTFVDISDIDNKTAGSYTATVYHGFQKFTYEVIVSDTTPPKITGSVHSVTVEKGDTVNMNKLGIQIQDYSSIRECIITSVRSSKVNLPKDSDTETTLMSLYQKGIAVNAETYEFSYGGKYQLIISATDAYENSSEYTLNVTVEEPPVMEAATSYYVATNSSIDFSKYITTRDFLDEDYSIEDVEIDTSELSFSAPGEYPVYFTGTDSYGQSTTVTATVYVMGENALQELINTHVINTGEQAIAGALNPYDNGYYTNRDTDYVLEAMRPCLVYIYNDTYPAAGSGYIIDISEDFVTIGTNQHVIKNDMTLDVYFSDGSLRYGSVVASDPKNDIAFIRIPIDNSGSEASVSPEYVAGNLRTVHINKSYWDSLQDRPGITVCYNCLDKTGNSWLTDVGTMVEKFCVRNWNQYTKINETIISATAVAGTSGSAIFDDSGRFMGMMRGYTNYDGYTETVVIPLSIILEYYESIFDEPVQYQ